MPNKQLPNPIVEAVSALIANKKTAFFAVLLMDQCELVYDPSCPTAATDGKRIIFGDWYCGLPIGERVFVLCHEILHVAYYHIPRSTAYRQRGVGMDFKPWDDMRANKAQDYVINDVLVESRIGTIPSIALHRRWQDDGSKTWDNVYQELPEEPRGGEQPERQPGEPGQGSMDEHMPSAVPDSPEAKQAAKEAVTQAAEAAKQTGEMPGALERALNELLEPRIPWRQQLREFVSACAGRDELSFRQFNRRRLVTHKAILPGRDGFQLECAVLTIDTSGSISEEELTAFLSEVRSIFEDLQPRELHIVWWDTDTVVEQIEDLDDIEKATPYGGGGTDYTGVPRVIDMHGLEPDCVICFTDGMVRWGDPSAITWPHLTVSTMEPYGAPFGRTIFLEV